MVDQKELGWETGCDSECCEHTLTVTIETPDWAFVEGTKFTVRLSGENIDMPFDLADMMDVAMEEFRRDELSDSLTADYTLGRKFNRARGVITLGDV